MLFLLRKIDFVNMCAISRNAASEKKNNKIAETKKAECDSYNKKSEQASSGEFRISLIKI